MTITQLQYFCAACRYGSITKAAEALFVSHPAVSVAIKSLEKEFGIDLYTHTGNRVILTEDGRAFYRHALDILQRCDAMYADFAGRPEDSYRVQMGIPPIRSVLLFPKLLQDLQKKHPVPVVLHEYSSGRCLQKLDNGELDCCLVNFRDADLSRFHHQVLLQDRFVFGIAREHPLAQRDFVTPKDLRDIPLLLQNDDSVQNQPLLQAFYKANVTPNILLYSSQVLTVLNFLRAGCGGAFLYETAVPKGEFDILPFRPEIRAKFVLVWPKGGYLNRNVQFVLTFIQQYFT